MPLRGTTDGQSIRMTSGTNERTGMRDGQPVKMKVRWDFRGELKGSTLAGILFLYLGNGELPAPARQWEGRRVPPP
jgi:hypothetical protein